MPVEDYIRNGQYELRAELPGLDPERDVEITVAGEILTITAHRSSPEPPHTCPGGSAHQADLTGGPSSYQGES
jgi:hypothetical protein